jgi:hypothetical protein
VETTTRSPRVERRDQVREALAGARARLGQEVLTACECRLDGNRKRRLLGARLVAREDLLEPAVGAEDRIHREQAYGAARPEEHLFALSSPKCSQRAAFSCLTGLQPVK